MAERVVTTVFFTLMCVTILGLMGGLLFFGLGTLIEIFGAPGVAWIAAKIGAGIGAALGALLMFSVGLFPRGRPAPWTPDEWPEDPEDYKD